MAKFVALDLLQQFSSNARQARGADDTPAVGGGADGGSVVAGGSGAAVGRQPVGDSDHQAPLSRRGRDVSLSDDDYRPRYDDYCGSSSDGSDSEGESDQEARVLRSRRVRDATAWHRDSEHEGDEGEEAGISGVQSLIAPDTPGGAVGGEVSGLVDGLGADLFDDTAAGPDFSIDPTVSVTPGDWSASADVDRVVGSLLGGSDSSHQVSTTPQPSGPSGSRKRSAVGIMKNGGTKRKAPGRPKSQSTPAPPAREGPAFAEPMVFPPEGLWKSENAKAVPGASVFSPVNQQADAMRDPVTPGLQIDTSCLKTPLDFLKLFLTDDLVQKHVDDTNHHAEQIKRTQPMKRRSRKHLWTPVTVTVMLQFFGIIYHMGIVHLPKITDYWRKSRLYAQDFYRGLMGRDTFQNILRFWFFGDEADDDNEAQPRDAKVFSLVDHLNNVMRRIYVPRQHLSLDESLLAWRGRLKFRVYMGKAGKHCKYGIKYFELTTHDGLIVRIVMHTASQEFEDPLKLGQSGAVVLKLMEDFLQQGYKLYMDNFYNSVPLFQVLAREMTLVCGTVQKKRKGLPKAILKAKKKKGQWAWQTNDSLTFCSWFDKQDVLTLSNMHPEVKMVPFVNKRKQTIWKPNIVLDYNKYMSGIDRSDQMLSYHSSLRKTIRWYKKVGVHLLEVFLVNAHYLYLETAKTRSDLRALTLLEFREQIILSLVGQDKRVKLPKKPENRPRAGFHYPEPFPAVENVKRAKPIKDCLHCKQTLEGRPRSTRMFCAVCPNRPPLCVHPCFRDYHTGLVIDETPRSDESSESSDDSNDDSSDEE